MSDRFFIIIGCLVSCLIAATISISILYTSDRKTHGTVEANTNKIDAIASQLKEAREELKVCIEKGARR